MIGTLAVLLATAAFHAQPGHTPPRQDCVILLHGLARTSSSMDKMASALNSAGYVVVNQSYPSRKHPIETLAPLAIDDGLRQCSAGLATGRVHFVTHSLGGILLRYYTAHQDIDSIGRAVMLAPPNQGSNAADTLGTWPIVDQINGPAGDQLGKGDDSVPLQLGRPDFEFAVIAGNRTIDPITSAVLKNPDDGKVSVEDTKLEGMAAFAVVEVSHAYIMKNDDVIALVVQFLLTGSFGSAHYSVPDAQDMLRDF